MVWTLSSIIYNLVMILGVYRGKLASEVIIFMWLATFLIGAIEFNGYKKSSTK
jgi:hypothetical protein